MRKKSSASVEVKKTVNLQKKIYLLKLNFIFLSKEKSIQKVFNFM